MVDKVVKAWDAAVVRRWLESRVAAARVDQVTAERGGRDRQDDCDKAAAEEMLCMHLRTGHAADSAATFADALRKMQDREDFVWRGVYDDRRFDRHVRTQIRRLLKMAKTHDGFDNVLHYQ